MGLLLNHLGAYERLKKETGSFDVTKLQKHFS
jgi:hypothetical protein